MTRFAVIFACCACAATSRSQPPPAPVPDARPVAKPVEPHRDLVGELIAIANASCACTARADGGYEANPACAEGVEARYASWWRDVDRTAAIDDTSRAQEVDDAIVKYQRCVLLARFEAVSRAPLEAPRSCHDYRELLTRCSDKLPAVDLVGAWNGWVQQRLVRNWRRIQRDERDNIVSWCDAARNAVEFKTGCR